MILADRIKKVAAEHGKTISSLAAEMGLFQQALSRTINNPRITMLDLQRIAEAIGCDVTDFFVPKSDGYVCPHCGKPLKVRIE